MIAPRLRRDLIFRRVEDDFAVYDPVADRTTLLNPSAAVIFELCDGVRSVEEIATHVAGVFTVAPTCLDAQVRTALAELAAHGLLEAEGVGPA